MTEKEFILGGIIAGMAIMFVATAVIRAILWYATVNKERDFCNVVKTIGLWFFALISPDYVAAYLSKENIKKCCGKDDKNAERPDEEQKQSDERAKMTTKYITSANTVNLIFSVMLMIVAACVAMFCDGWVYNIFYGIVAYRLLSRTLEINISFVRDIADDKKKSSLEPGQRVSLAIRSLVEEAALFAAIYCFILHITSDCWLDAFTGGLFSFVLDVFSSCKCNMLLRFVSAYQKVCSVILVTLCIASYLDGRKNGNGNKPGGNTDGNKPNNPVQPDGNASVVNEEKAADETEVKSPERPKNTQKLKKIKQTKKNKPTETNPTE